METIERFVLDTSLFTNPHAYACFDREAEPAMRSFLGLATSARAEFYMPTSVFEELCKMRNLGPLEAEFELRVHIRSPRKHALQIPAYILYEFIEEVRHRMDRGLRIAEEHARLGLGSETNDAGALITRLRERYREVLRRGIIDSREDADVLLLAFELDATLVTADEGLRTWADKVGVKLIHPSNFRSMLEHLS